MIGILTLFTVITWIASLVAEELKNKTDRELLSFHNAHNQLSPSQKLEKWLREFHLFNCFVERINKCFGLILLIALSNICILSTYYWFRMGRRLSNNSSNIPLAIMEFGSPLILLYFRLLILVIGSNHLHAKVYSFFNVFFMHSHLVL